MLIDRLPSGSPVFSCIWRDFIAEWRKADNKHKAVLDDGRPAVIHDGEPPSYHTIVPSLWEEIRPKLKELLATTSHPPRTRLCQACGSAMQVTNEYEEVWTFACERCKSVEAWGKDQPGIGGTIGSGLKEKR